MSDAECHDEAAQPILGSSNRQSQPSDVSATTVTGSKGRVPCKFFLTRRGCSYGSECKYAHVVEATTASSEKSRDGGARGRVKPRKPSRVPVCRLYLSSASGCKYGDKCRYRHPARSNAREEGGGEEVEQTLRDGLQGATLDGSGEATECVEQQKSPPVADEPAALLNMNMFPGLGCGGEWREGGRKFTSSSNLLSFFVYIVTQQQQQQMTTVTPSHPHTSHTHKAHSSQSRKHVPAEISLASFMTTPTVGVRPHPTVCRPQRTTNKTTVELRQAELEQLETRFQGNYTLVEKGRERSVYLLTFAPTDPDWVS